MAEWESVIPWTPDINMPNVWRFRVPGGWVYSIGHNPVFVPAPPDGPRPGE